LSWHKLEPTVPYSFPNAAQGHRRMPSSFQSYDATIDVHLRTTSDAVFRDE